MIQLTILFIFFILHLLFFLNYFLFGTDYSEFFGMQISYRYSSSIAIETFIFASIAFFSIFLGLTSNKFLNFKAKSNKLWKGIYNTKAIKIFVILCSSISLFYSISLILDQVGYASISAARLNKQSINTILYELRYVTLIYISYNLLNYRIKDLLKNKMNI